MFLNVFKNRLFDSIAIITLESFSAVISGLQPMVQWICDLSITLLSSLPEYTASSKSGSWLVKDLSSVAALRESLLLARIWYNCMPKLRPTLSCSVSFDVIAKLFKMLTLLLSSLKNNDVMPDALLDECSLLPSQVSFVAKTWFFMVILFTSFSSHNLPGNNT